MFSCKSTQLTQQQKQEIRLHKEIEVLEHYGIKKSYDFQILDIQVTHNNQEYNIHTLHGGYGNEDIVLLLPGYCGSHVQFCRIYKDLLSKVQLFSIDLPGMGFSSKDNIDLKNKDDCMEFFMQTLHQFLIKMNFQRRIILIGHSFGGYIAAHLLVRHPEYFKQAILMSPAGTTQYTEEEIKKMSEKMIDNSFFRRQFFKFAQNKWNEMCTPQLLKDKWYGGFMINRYLKKRIGLKGREYDLWEAYADELTNLPEGSEKALFIMLNFPRVYAKQEESIEYILTHEKERLGNTPITFYYGSYDWMDSHGAQRLSSNYQNIACEIIKDAGHQLSFENPENLVKQIVHDIFSHKHITISYNNQAMKQALHNEIEFQIPV